MGLVVWLGSMKTTINLDDDLLNAVRARAEGRGQTMREVVEEALRRLLTAPEQSTFHLELPATPGRRLPTVDVDSNAALAEYLDRIERHDPAGP